MTDERQAEIEQLKARIAELEGSEEPTVDDQIAEAQAAGDWGRSLALKAGGILSGQQQANPIPADEVEAPDEDAAKTVAELEAEGRHGEAMAAKLQAAGMGHFIPR